MLNHHVRVRFGECDGLGHVNNTTYFTYMEDARVDVFAICNPSLELAKWNLIVAGTRSDFLAQVSFAEQLTIDTWISKIGNSSFMVEHAIRNAEDTYVARGQATLIYYDYDEQRSQPLPDALRERLAAHTEGPAAAPSLRA